MEEERIKIIQDTTDVNYVYVVRDNGTRDGVRLYSRKYMLRELNAAFTWRVQLMEPDGTYNPCSRVFYEGSDAEEVLRKVIPDWGVWVITEVEDIEDEFEKMFIDAFGKVEPRQYIISLNVIL